MSRLEDQPWAAMDREALDQALAELRALPRDVLSQTSTHLLMICVHVMQHPIEREHAQFIRPSGWCEKCGGPCRLDPPTVELDPERMSAAAKCLHAAAKVLYVLAREGGR